MKVTDFSIFFFQMSSHHTHVAKSSGNYRTRQPPVIFTLHSSHFVLCSITGNVHLMRCGAAMDPISGKRHKGNSRGSQISKNKAQLILFHLSTGVQLNRYTLRGSVSYRSPTVPCEGRMDDAAEVAAVSYGTMMMAKRQHLVMKPSSSFRKLVSKWVVLFSCASWSCPGCSVENSRLGIHCTENWHHKKENRKREASQQRVMTTRFRGRR